MKEIFTLNDFSGGINSVKDPRDIEINQLAVAQNIMVDEQGAIRTPGGWVSINSPTNISPQAATLVGGYGLEILESDYETEVISITGSSNLDFASSGVITMTTKITSFADAGGGQVTVNATAHGMSENASVQIIGTEPYDGTHTITNVSANAFEITDIWTVDDPNGDVYLRLGVTFPIGTEIEISGTTNNNELVIVKRLNTNGYRLYCDSFTSELNTSGTISFLPKEEILVLLSDSDYSKVDTYSKNQDTWTSDQVNINPSGITLEANSKTVFYSIDGAIRVSDADFDNTIQVKWFGQIKRTHFAMANGVNSAQHNFFNFYETDNKLSPPTDGIIHFVNYPTKNIGFNVRITMSANDSSEWENEIVYQVAFSFIYDGNQESLLYIPTSNNTFETEGGKSVNMSIRALQGSATDDTDCYDPRISGGRIYARKDGSDESWFLLADIDMRRGARATLDGDFSPWATISPITTATGFIESLAPNTTDTYESLNAYSHDVVKNSIGEDGEQWKFGLVANRRAFIFNVRRYDEATGQNVTFGDRIYYSEPNKFDTFLPDNYFTPVRGDSENYVCGIEFADRILAFKQNSVQIINISAAQPIDWLVESKHKYMGIRNPSAITRTEFGVAWINDSGCYFYDGQGLPKNLIGDDINNIPSKVDDDEWATFIGITSTHQSIIGYERHKKQLIIMRDCTGNAETDSTVDSGDAYLYDFKTSSWVKLIDAFTDSVVYSNFQHDWNGYLIICKENSTNVEFYKWDSDDTTAKSDIELRTKDIDFGSPGIYTKIYKIIMTYKSSVNQTTPLEYSIDGEDDWTAFDNISIDGGTADSTMDSSSHWQVAVFNDSANFPLLVQSLQLRLNPASVGTININDISIQYRNLPNKHVK